MLTQTDFEGGVFHPSIEGGRAGARIEIGAAELIARSVEGQVFRLPFSQVQLEEGGASGRMIFCRNADRTLTIFCEERQFLPALTEFSGGLLAEQLEKIRGSRSAGRWGCLAIGVVSLIALALTLFVAYLILTWLVGQAVHTLPTAIDEQLGKAAAGQVEQGLDGPVMRSKEVAEPIDVILARLKPHAPVDFPFQIKVIDAPVVNAFALPGGYIYVYRGLIDEAESADEVAGVIAHEMAHVTQRHHLQRLGQSVGLVVGIQLVIGDVGGLLALGAEILKSATVSSYSRDQELEADLVGSKMMYDAGLDPLACVKFFERLEKKEGKMGLGEWLADHPDHAKRIDAMKAQSVDWPARKREPLDVDFAAWKQALAADGGLAAPAPAEPQVEADPADEKPADEEPADEQPAPLPLELEKSEEAPLGEPKRLVSPLRGAALIQPAPSGPLAL